jgi:hypothetical protein
MSSSWIRALFFLLDNVYKMWSTGWYKIRNVVSTANFLISGEYDFFPNNYRIRISNLLERNAPIPIFGFTNKSFAVKHEAHQPILSHLDFICPSPLLWGLPMMRIPRSLNLDQPTGMPTIFRLLSFLVQWNLVSSREVNQQPANRDSF